MDWIHFGDNVSRPFIKGELLGTVLPILLDSGSKVSCVNKDFVDHSDPSTYSKFTHPNLEHFLLESAFGGLCRPDFIMVPLKIGNRHYKHVFCVVDSLPCAALLGSDFITTYRVSILPESISFPSGKSLPLEPEVANASPAFLDKRVIVPPHQAVRLPLWTFLTGSSDQLVCVDPTKVHPQLAAVRVVCPLGVLQISVLNTSSSPVILHRNTIIAYVDCVEHTEPVFGKRLHKSPVFAAQPASSLPPLPEGVRIDRKHLSKAQQDSLELLIREFADLFRTPEDAPTRIHNVEHHVNTGNAKPIHSRAYRVSATEQEIIRKEIQKMLLMGVIRHSSSPWSSPIVVVMKKDGTRRFCVDYRKLNAVTERDVYPLPRIEEVLTYLQGKIIFSLCDAIFGFWQIPMSADSISKTAFISQDGLYEFLVMPFGLTNAPSTFQRLMDQVLQGIRFLFVLDYIDDLLTFSNSFEDHLVHLRELFSRLRHANVRLKAAKCQFGLSEIIFLGYVVSSDGIAPDPSKIAAVLKFPTPQNATDVRSFLGLCNYYRRFVKEFAHKAHPLHLLTRLNTPWRWTPEHQQAFDFFKKVLTEAPVLVLPDTTKPFVLYTDASTYAIGAILSQVYDDGDRVVSYLSRSLNSAEQNYTTTERECLAIVWSIKTFRPYLHGQDFTIITDHHSLVWLMTYKDASPRLLRWSITLQEYKFKVVYRPGKNHANVDALSRNVSVLAITSVKSSDSISIGPEFGESQRRDASLSYFYQLGLHQHDSFVLRNGVLFKRKSTPKQLQKWLKLDPSDDNLLYLYQDCLVIPASARAEALTIVHDDAFSGAHMGFRKCWLKLQQRFWWPRMAKDLDHWIKSCKICAQFSPSKPPRVGKLMSIPVMSPFEIVGVDVVGPLTITSKHRRFIVVITDHFSKWAEAFPVTNHSATVVADLLVREVFSRYGVPKKILTDQGQEFMSLMIAVLCQLFGADKINTSTYHPQTDGNTERFNRTLCKMLKAYTKANQRDWDEHIHLVLFAYRTSIHTSTGFTPFFLLHGYDALYPVDVKVNPELGQPLPYPAYVNRLAKRLTLAQELVQDHIQRAQQRQAYYYDKLTKSAREYEIGDLVMEYTPTTKEKLSKKLLPKWFGPYEVIAKTTPVNYKLVCPGSKQQPWVTHVSRLKPYFAPFDPSILPLKHFDFEIKGNVPNPIIFPLQNSEVVNPLSEVHTLPNTFDQLVSAVDDRKGSLSPLIDNIPPRDRSTTVDAIDQHLSSISTSNLSSETTTHCVIGDELCTTNPSLVSDSATLIPKPPLGAPTHKISKYKSHKNSTSNSDSESDHEHPLPATDANIDAKILSQFSPQIQAAFENIGYIPPTITTYSNIDRPFSLTDPIDPSWTISHIIDYAPHGERRKSLDFYLVAFKDQPPSSNRWTTMPQLRLLPGFHEGIDRSFFHDFQKTQAMLRSRKKHIKA